MWTPFRSCRWQTRLTHSGLALVILIGMMCLGVQVFSTYSLTLVLHRQPHTIPWRIPVTVQRAQHPQFLHSRHANDVNNRRTDSRGDLTFHQTYSIRPFQSRSINISVFDKRSALRIFSLENQTYGISFDDAISGEEKHDRDDPLQTEQTNWVFPDLNNFSLRSIDLTRVGQLNLLYFDTTKPESGSTNVQYYDPMQTRKDSSAKEMLRVKEPLVVSPDLSMAFQPLMNREERQLMLYIFHQFIRVCQASNLTYFLYGGSLLGAYRHHDVIPWDDDIDVMMDAGQRPQIINALSSIPGFGLSAPSGRQWKFYWKGAPTLKLRDYRWPYIDIFFFRTNGTHLYDDIRQYRANFRYPLTHVFPLQLRPFAGALLPVPCNMPAVLRVNYFPWLCVTSSYLHKLESPAPRHLEARAACSRLFSLFPFVFRQSVDESSTIEMLVRGGEVIRKVRMPAFCGQDTPLTSP